MPYKLIEGEKIKDWRGYAESSIIYVAIVDEGFCDDMICLEQTLHAKSIKIPSILVIKEGINQTIPDLFDGLNLIMTLYYNDSNKEEVMKKLGEKLRETKIKLDKEFGRENET
ncbi:hypothetical protein LCGC14_1506050 [marine sediment metagenome]|uniref:TIR domain-containing protein n=1 Tax=marine sediment metagenome TaxID=412755 RepID=A0A0F9J349_9ZZZZ